jgi:hypothetical protein
METAYDGRQVVGMDLHRRRSVLVRMTGDGQRLATARIANSPAELRREIARAGKSPKVVLRQPTGGTGRRILWPRPGPRYTWRTRSG